MFPLKWWPSKYACVFHEDLLACGIECICVGCMCEGVHVILAWCVCGGVIHVGCV